MHPYAAPRAASEAATGPARKRSSWVILSGLPTGPPADSGKVGSVRMDHQGVRDPRACATWPGLAAESDPVGERHLAPGPVRYMMRLVSPSNMGGPPSRPESTLPTHTDTYRLGGDNHVVVVTMRFGSLCGLGNSRSSGSRR
jgi:hypothetical protein